MSAKIQAVLGLFRSNRPGESEAQIRSRDRYRKALLAGLMSAAARAINIVAVLISIPVTLKYLGVERFSVWMTITSLTALLAFADLGLGNGLMNAVTRCEAREDYHELRAYVSAALLVLGCLAALGIGFALLFAPHVAWLSLLAVDSRQVPAGELAHVMMALIVCLAVGLPVAVVQKVQLALQLGYLASLWQLAGSVAGLVALLAAIGLHASLTWLVVAALATPNVVLALSAWVFWGYQKPQYRPAPSLAGVEHISQLARSGFLFFVIQVGGAVALASDNLIIAHVLGAQAVAQYSVASRLFEGVVMIGALFINPLWPAYADAYARRDGRWIKRTLASSMVMTAVGTAVLCAVLVGIGRPLVSLWVGSAVPYSVALFAACAVWATIKASGNALAMFLNGLGWIGVQALLSVVYAVVAVVMKISLAQEIGVAAIPIALAAAYVVVVVPLYVWHVPRLIARLT